MSVLQARSHVANASKKARSAGRAPEQDTAVLDARRELAEAKIQEFIARTVATAPPLTLEQRARLAALVHEVSE